MDGIVPLVFLLLLLAVVVNFAALLFGLYFAFSKAAATKIHFHIFKGFAVLSIFLAIVSVLFVATAIGILPFVICVLLGVVWLLVCRQVSKKVNLAKPSET